MDEVNLPIPPAPVASPADAPASDALPAPAEAQPEDATRDPSRVYTQDELDKIAAKIKKNERYRTKKEIEAYYQGRESAQPKPEPQQPVGGEPQPPVRASFASYEEYLDAKAEFTGRRAAENYRKEYEAKQSAEKQAAERTKRTTEFQTKLNEKYPDITERVGAIAHIQMPEGMSDAITESEFGPDILNHFASNPEDFERIAALKPSHALREIGRLEARLEGAPPKKPELVAVKPPSRAPAPIKPLSGSAVSSDDEPSHNDPDKWMAWRNRQVQKKRA